MKKSKFVSSDFITTIKLKLINFIKSREFNLLIVFAIMCIVLAIIAPGFLTYGNFWSLAASESMKGLVVIGMTLLLITQAFDLSVASVMALSGVLAAWLLNQGYPVPLSILGGLVTGCFTGFINGLMVTKLKINSLISTLAMMYMARGMALVITAGQPISNFPENFVILGHITILGMPIGFFILIIIALFLSFLVGWSRFFLQIFYVGSNNLAADMVGINSSRMRMLMFVLTGFFAAFAGVMMTARMRTAIPTSFMRVELYIIASCIIGGASLTGGQGSIIGSILGFIILTLISNAMTLLGLSVYIEGVVVGSILITAAIYDMWSQKKLVTS